MRRFATLLAIVLTLASCGEEGALPTSTLAPTVTVASGPTTAAPTASTVIERATPTSTRAVRSTTTTRDLDACRRIADLEDAEELLRWRLVNDGVMGGRSSAESGVAASVLTVAGEIVTEGGGFSSVRFALDQPLGDVSSVAIRLRTDGRAYEFTAADASPGRDRRVSHQGPIPTTGTDWEVVTIDLVDLDASIFGEPVSVAPFDPTTSVEIGIILADGTDGPFRFELDWISACE